MPKRLLTRCAFRGCPRKTRERYCSEHAPQAAKLYDRRRGRADERGYDYAWQRIAKERRRLDACLCQRCLPERVTVSQLVDHIVPIHVRPDWRLEIGNTQVLCYDCHSVKTSEDMRRYGGRARKQLTPQQIAGREAAGLLGRPPRDGPGIRTEPQAPGEPLLWGL